MGWLEPFIGKIMAILITFW